VRLWLGGLVRWAGSFEGDAAATMRPVEIASGTKVPSRVERLSKFRKGVLEAPMPNNPDEAILMINKELDAVEDAWSGIPKDVNAASMPNRNDGRMYGILDEKFVTRHSDGRVTAYTKGHRIEIQLNGRLDFYGKDGKVFLSKQHE
jgi:hypothetical protein